MESSPQQATEIEGREISLDFLRGLSLVAMVAAHFAYRVPHSSAYAKMFEFLVEGAAPFFFSVLE